MNTVFLSPLKKKSVHHQTSRMYNSGSKALCEVAVHQQAALCAVQLCCCRGLFSAWNRMVSREHSGGWALQCTAVLVALLCTPTRFHSCSASDNLSISHPYLYYLSCLPLFAVLLSFFAYFFFTLFQLTVIHVSNAGSYILHLNYPAPWHSHAQLKTHLHKYIHYINTSCNLSQECMIKCPLLGYAKNTPTLSFLHLTVFIKVSF